MKYVIGTKIKSEWLKGEQVDKVGHPEESRTKRESLRTAAKVKAGQGSIC